MPILLLADHGLVQDFRDVQWGYLFALGVGQAVRNHPHAKRAVTAHRVGAGREQLLGSLIADAPVALFLFLEHLSPTGAAA